MTANDAWDKTREQTFTETAQTERGPGAPPGTLQDIQDTPTGSGDASMQAQRSQQSGTALVDVPQEGQTILNQGDAGKLGHTAKGQAMKGDSSAGSVINAPGESG